jgi:histidinol-phosphate/aromatic aminotransferase/cobyric acid decarboxylase-like protein
VKINNEVHQKQIECLFIASPNNPTGHALSRESINLLLETVQCSVILDESLLMATHSMGSVELVNKYKNLFICGSFSKLYGLAGLRIGYLVANYVHSQQLKKLVSPFGVDALGLEIAKHMVIQEAWLRERIAIINNSIAILQNINSPQLRITHTTAPIALIEYTGTTGSLYDMLLGQGVTTVASEEFLGLDKTNAVRIIIKDVTEILQLKRALANIL